MTSGSVYNSLNALRKVFLRDNPRYIALMEHWMDLINEERRKLGLASVELNYDAGSGVLPFSL